MFRMLKTEKSTLAGSDLTVEIKPKEGLRFEVAARPAAEDELKILFPKEFSYHNDRNDRLAG